MARFVDLRVCDNPRIIPRVFETVKVDADRVLWYKNKDIHAGALTTVTLEAGKDTKEVIYIDAEDAPKLEGTNPLTLLEQIHDQIGYLNMTVENFYQNILQR